MSFSEAVRACLSNYANFNGRAKRSEFWWFYLFAALIGLAGYVVYFILFGIAAALGDNALASVFTILALIWSIALLAVSIGLYIPLLAVGCRRLHDYGMSGWMQLLLLVPCANFALIVLWALEGTRGPNQYGPVNLNTWV